MREVYAMLAKKWLVSFALAALATTGPALARPHHFPYADAGLTPQQAAAHLLNRLAYGPRPGQVDEVARQGLEVWVEQQMRAPLTNGQLDRALGVVPEDSGDIRMRQRKLLRAVYGPNQISEVLTDFWFNHFNVSLTNGSCKPYVVSYERDAIRPNALGHFRQLLGATAHHPAMLYYLDNALSTAGKVTNPKSADSGKDPLHYGTKNRFDEPMMETGTRQGGLNENYARELLELHTLGVDGGYRQDDVKEVARCFTGWTVLATKEKPPTGNFQFKPENHDNGTKKVLFTPISPAGQAEGEKVLDLLATNSHTAKFIARKFAVRFYSDSPPAEVVENIRKTFQRTQGDTREMIFALLESPEFWSSDCLRAKVKTPFELEASALRITGARLEPKSPIVRELSSMGQEVYSCRPPTGWPDRADYWVSPGNMLTRMAFALELGNGSAKGVRVDFTKLRPAKPAPTPQKALTVYAEMMLPGRDIKSTENLLLQAVLDPDYERKVQDARKSKGRIPKAVAASKAAAEMNDKMAGKVIGLLLGCPEFQRR